MGFMQRDIDFKLILLIILVIIAIVGLTLFYQSSAGDIIRKYNKVTENLEKAQENLSVTQTRYDACIAKVSNLSAELEGATEYQLNAQDEFNTLYTETQETLQETETSLQNAQDELEEAQSDLSNAQSELSTCQATNQEIIDDVNSAEGYAEDVEDTLDNCKSCSDVSSCNSCINDALSDIGQVNNYLDQIEG